jgi:hypothetical protein
MRSAAMAGRMPVLGAILGIDRSGIDNEAVMPPATMHETQTLTERVRDALLDAFTVSDLTILLSDRLGTTLDDVVNRNQGNRAVVFDLVQWALRQRRLCELLAVAAERVPGRPILADLCSECRVLPPTDATTPIDDDRLREAVVLFAERFRQRKRSVRWLEAYKSLHDVLHELEEFQDSIHRAVAASRGGPPGPDPEGVADQLRDWAATARDRADQTKRPDRHRPWVQELGRSVDVVALALTGAAPPADVVDRAVERLANLPPERQSGLNDLLIDTLADFNTDDLQQPLAQVLDAVRAARGGDEFERRLTEFQEAVKTVADRSRDHDLCQRVSDVLIQAFRLNVVTIDKITDWTEARAWLNELAGYRPNDLRTQRTAESANKFDQANAGPEATAAFRRLEERFADLFSFTDKALLADTQRLVSTADALSGHLDGVLK